MAGNSTCPSSAAFGQDIADLGVTVRPEQAMANSLEYKTPEDQARSQHEAVAINATLAWGARGNAGNAPYQPDGHGSSSATSADSLNRLWYTAKAEDTGGSGYEGAPTDEPDHSDEQTGWLLSRGGPRSPNRRDSTFRNWNLGSLRSCSLMRRISLLHNVVTPRPASSFLR